MRFAFLVGVLLLLSSCASNLNKSTTKIKVESDQATTIQIDTVYYRVDPKKNILVQRSKDSLVLIASRESIQKEFKLAPKNSIAYYSNALYTLGIGFLKDAKSDKRYTYQSNVYVDFDNSGITRFAPHRKGQLEVYLSIPYLNSFFLQPEGESSQSTFGFFGFRTGLEYYYKQNKSIGFSLGAATDFPIPVPASVNYDGEYETSSSIYASITDNVKLNDFSFGYGLNFAKNNWELKFSDGFEPPSTSKKPVSRSNESLGITLNSYYRVGKHFNVGIMYSPSLLKLNENIEFQYEHVLSLDLVWKWKIKK